MADSPSQATSLSSKGQEASVKACRSSTDKISSLPDALIHRILSFLPTKEAMATSVLSRRWVRLWTLVPALDLDDSFCCSYNERAQMKFVNFIYRVLLLNKAGTFEKFRLKCSQIYGRSYINTWICSAIERGLQEVVDISISVSASEIGKEDLVKIPSGLFLMKTLKILKLHGGIMVDVPSSVCFPGLKSLHLLRVNYANAESVRSLVSGCPSLEELHIDTGMSPENMVNLNISTSILNRLSLTLNYDHRKIEINAPALKFLTFSSCLSEPIRYIVQNSPHLIEANISVLDIYTAVRALKGVKCLKLCAHMGPATRFPMFANLTQLELPTDPRRHGMCWAVVSLFLQNSPRLKTLVVHDKMFTRWRELELPELAPICFEVSLTRACFEFEGLEEELKMAEYFLKNAIVLRTMEICTSDLSSDSKFCFLEKLSTFPRSSETCELSFV